MFKRKSIIYSTVVILATILTSIILIVGNKNEATSKQYSNINNDKNESLSLAYTQSKEENEIKVITYTVKSGDSLESIASTYKVKVNTIAESNNLSVNAILTEGQLLEFPSINGVLYKIQNGETLWDLTMLNKVDFNKVVEINKLESPEKLKLGQKIIMPDVEKVKPVASNTSTSDKKIVASNKTLSRGGSIPTIGSSLPVSGKISSTYGPRWGRQHAGLDIAAPTGTDVFAFMDGKVTFSGWDDGGYGNLIIIDHGNGLQGYYAHNSKLLVKKGQSVNKGTQIADVGSTGNSTGPHSHFEVRKNGTPVNPYSYLN